jgi:CRISPR/Cas system-associated endoribonuclease Cas2
LEQRARKGKRKGILQQAILGSLLVGGAIVAPALAFSVIGAVGALVSMSGKKRYYTSDVDRSLESLLGKGYVEFVGAPKKHLKITNKGRKYLEEIEGTRYQLERPKKWDKQYRVVIFDISEQRKGIREQLRHILTDIGFMRLQDSVWVYPYDCEEVVTLIKTDFKIGRDILYRVVKEIEYDKPIRAYFNLPRPD